MKAASLGITLMKVLIRYTTFALVVDCIAAIIIIYCSLNIQKGKNRKVREICFWITWGITVIWGILATCVQYAW